jgi:hypothetical protein
MSESNYINAVDLQCAKVTDSLRKAPEICILSMLCRDAYRSIVRPSAMGASGSITLTIRS